jgi:hypothetical protein
MKKECVSLCGFLKLDLLQEFNGGHESVGEDGAAQTAR